MRNPHFVILSRLLDPAPWTRGLRSSGVIGDPYLVVVRTPGRCCGPGSHVRRPVPPFPRSSLSRHHEHVDSETGCHRRLLPGDWVQPREALRSMDTSEKTPRRDTLVLSCPCFLKKTWTPEYRGHGHRGPLPGSLVLALEVRSVLVCIAEPLVRTCSISLLACAESQPDAVVPHKRLCRGVWGKVGSVVTLRAVQGVILVRK